MQRRFCTHSRSFYDTVLAIVPMGYIVCTVEVKKYRGFRRILRLKNLRAKRARLCTPPPKIVDPPLAPSVIFYVHSRESEAMGTKYTVLQSALPYMKMDASSEATAFRRCVSVLKTGLKNDLCSVALGLFARGLISDDNHSKIGSGAEPCNERAAHLVIVLLDRISIQPSAFYQILEELDACSVLNILSSKLRYELEQVKKEAAGPPVSL